MNGKKIKCMVSYDGTNFSGFQIQPTKRTVQGELEKALTSIHKGTPIRIYSSGRTDAGVHAIGQVIHFETMNPMVPWNWKKALNALLPNDIFIKSVEQVDISFHARFSAIGKEYRYFIRNNVDPDIFKRNYVYHFPYELNVDAIKEACKYLEGEHDFTTFSSARTTVQGSRIRNLYHAACEQQGTDIIFVFRGSGFLYNMVRILVGTLLEVGQGKRKPIDMITLLQQKDRTLAGKTAPPQGLYLWEVTYPSDEI